ncbi:gag-protease polyprotein [Cucumis melo var. makuwa]|uniref:Gag-protease polyprotein n=1 Tax=Cucumis melo var. makuwa TaxID=1194695 RepID=A0A5D3E658_CUCMM|nr:gag-protease polyprotein [Cucumis melo var. makuwa]TYK31563.1 gag-protease polyprotein [Cucumis melo var. makuwa]
MSDRLSAEATHLRDFMKYKPKIFDESLEDHIKAQLWLASVETIFWRMKCPNNHKVYLKDAKQQEFLELQQGDMTVEQYDLEFDMLFRFAPEMVATEAAKADKFVRGLRERVNLRSEEKGSVVAYHSAIEEHY